MKRRNFLQLVAALAGLPFLPKAAAKPETHTLTLSEVPPHSHIPAGTIQPYAWRDEPPPGWLPCDGRVISQCHHPVLCDVLGSNKLPDLNSRIMMHAVPDDPERPWLSGSHGEKISYEAYTGLRYMIKAK